MSKPVLKCDLRENTKGELYGPLAISGDGRAVLEAIYLIIEQFSASVEVPSQEIAADLYRLVAGKVKP